MKIELKTDLLLVKYSRDGEEHTYELWMIPENQPGTRELLHTSCGEDHDQIRALIELSIRQTLNNLKEEGISLPVLWANREDEIFVVEELEHDV